MRSCAGCHSSRILEPASTSNKSPSCGLCRGTYRGASTPIAGSGVSWLDPLLSSGFVELAGPRLHGLMGVIFSEGELTQVR